MILVAKGDLATLTPFLKNKYLEDGGRIVIFKKDNGDKVYEAWKVSK